jgi:phospholipid/cholesterol/gamma-HCH transport system ATP-binding protein
MAAITMNHIVKRYGDGYVAVKDVSLDIKDGEFMILVGPSGCGKSTVLRMIVGLEDITSGEMRIDNKVVNTIAPRKRNLAMVFQNYALYPHLTVFENIAFPLREHTKLGEREIRDQVREKLSILGLEGTDRLFPSELSGGMRKRVGLARALMRKPEILIYDEPTSGLDPNTSRMVDDLIEEMRQRFHVTNVVISHDMASTFRIAHQAFLLVEGRIAASGTPDEILQGDSEAARDFIRASGVDVARISRPPQA